MWIVSFLAEQDGAAPVNSLPGCYERQIDEHWFIAVNGHKESQKTKGGTGGISVEPFHLYVEFNGWPTGYVTPYGGIIAAGDAANEGAFIEACEKALGKTIAELQAELEPTR